MKEKSTLKSKKLESIDSEMFSPFDPEDESWMAGGSKITNTAMATYSPGGPDAEVDIDFWDFEAPDNPGTN